LKNLKFPLDSIKNDINDTYANGKISKVHYETLMEKLSEAIRYAKRNKGTQDKRGPI